MQMSVEAASVEKPLDESNININARGNRESEGEKEYWKRKKSKRIERENWERKRTRRTESEGERRERKRRKLKKKEKELMENREGVRWRRLGNHTLAHGGEPGSGEPGSDLQLLLFNDGVSLQFNFSLVAIELRICSTPPVCTCSSTHHQLLVSITLLACQQHNHTKQTSLESFPLH